MNIPTPRYKPLDLLQLKHAPSIKFYVQEVIIQQCYGGFQIHYDGKLVAKSSNYNVASPNIVEGKITRWTEPELEPSTPAISGSSIELTSMLKEQLIKEGKFEEASIARDIQRLMEMMDKKKEDA